MNRTVCPNGMADTCKEKIEFLEQTNMLYSEVTSELLLKNIEEHKINDELQAEIERLKQRTWVGLSNGEMIEISEMQLGSWDLILEVEAKLKERNT